MNNSHSEILHVRICSNAKKEWNGASYALSQW